MSLKKTLSSLNFIKALIYQVNPSLSEKEDQEILKEEGVIGIEDEFILLESRILDCKMPDGEIIQVPITQDLLNEVIDSFIIEHESEIKEKLLEQLNEQLPNQ